MSEFPEIPDALLGRDEVDNVKYIGYYYYVGPIDADNSDLPGHDGLINARLFNNFTPSVDDTAAGDGITLITITGPFHPTLAGNNDASQIEPVGSGSLLFASMTGDDQDHCSGNINGNPLNNTGAKNDRVAFELQHTSLPPVKAAFNQAQLEQVVRFEEAARPFTLPVRTGAQPHTFDLILDAYPFHRRSQRRFRLLSVFRLDDWGNDVADDFYAIKIRADITLAKGNDLIYTFLHARIAMKADEAHRFHLLILVKQ